MFHERVPPLLQLYALRGIRDTSMLECEFIVECLTHQKGLADTPAAIDHDELGVFIVISVAKQLHLFFPTDNHSY